MLYRIEGWVLTMLKPITVSCLLLIACTSTNGQSPIWDIGGAKLTLLIPMPTLSADKIVFETTAKNASDLPVCFDGNGAFPVGLGLTSVESGAPLAYLNLPGERDVGHLAPTRFERKILAPGSSRSFTITLPRPISGPYEVPFVSSHYKKGDLLSAQASTEFYDCDYPSVELASADGRSTTVHSPLSEPFREN